MEKAGSLCKNNVPREEIVVRKDNDIVKEAFKLKCMKFRFKEAESIDNGEVDAEMSRLIVDVDNINTNYTSIEIKKNENPHT